MLRSHTLIALIGCKYTKVFLITGNYAIFFKRHKNKEPDTEAEDIAMGSSSLRISLRLHRISQAGNAFHPQGHQDNHRNSLESRMLHLLPCLCPGFGLPAFAEE